MTVILDIDKVDRFWFFSQLMPPEDLAEIIKLEDTGVITHKTAVELFNEMYYTRLAEFLVLYLKRGEPIND